MFVVSVWYVSVILICFLKVTVCTEIGQVKFYPEQNEQLT